MATLDLATPGANQTAPGFHKPGHVTVRTPWLQVRFNVRVLGMSLFVFGLLAVLAVFAMTLGSYRIPFVDVVKSVFGHGNDDQEFIVRTLRLPRLICAMLIGAALAMAGAIFQGLVRNPLVSPDIIGIDTGATLVAVFWIVFGFNSQWLPLGAFIGAVSAAMLVYLLSWKRGINPNRLILVGIGVGAAISAGTTFITVRFPIDQVRPAIVWTMGSIYGSNWTDVKTLLGFVIVCLPIGVGMMWHLRALQLGDDAARGLGIPIERTRLGLMLVGCGLAAVTVSVAGPIGFVALMVPHIARMLGGALSSSVLVLTALLGAFFLLAADTVAQHFLPVALPVGVVTSAVGAPYFLFLLYRSNVRM
ncbi:MAG TPA: iron ABC transporter permease [Thermomicrobiales bacterium]|nr:iron ABC transporter permease [Thermomicrobiales bacterium]